MKIIITALLSLPIVLSARADDAVDTYSLSCDSIAEAPEPRFDYCASLVYLKGGLKDLQSAAPRVFKVNKWSSRYKHAGSSFAYCSGDSRESLRMQSTRFACAAFSRTLTDHSRYRVCQSMLYRFPDEVIRSFAMAVTLGLRAIYGGGCASDRLWGDDALSPEACSVFYR